VKGNDSSEEVRKMRKGIIALALMAACGSAVAADLNPGAGRAQAVGSGGTYPWLLHLKTLWGRGVGCEDINAVWANDGDCWNYPDPNDPCEPYLYQVFELARPAGYDSGTLRWRIWGNSGQTINIWRWKNSTEQWVWIDSYSGVNIPLQTYESVPAGWFNVYNYDQYYLYILATVAEGPTTHNIIADICDIQW
jgi:hypothetical protein